MNRNIGALAAAIAASLGATQVANATVYSAVLNTVKSYSNNGSSAANLTSSTATFQYDDATGVLTQTGGEYVAQYNINPTTTLFRHNITGLIIGNGAAATGDSYTCTEGTFGGNVGASLCGNYNFGANFLNESTVSWGPGTATDRTIVGDDVVLGLQQSIEQLDGFTQESLSGDPLTLVITNRACTVADCSGLPDNANSGYTWTLTVTELVAEAVDDTDSTHLNTPVETDVLANDTLFGATVDVAITTPPDAGGAVEMLDDGVVCDPCNGVDPATFSVRLTPMAGLDTPNYTENYGYTVTDGGEGYSANVAVDVENALPVAGDTTIDIDTQGVDPATVTGTVNAGTLAGNDLGDAPSTVDATDGATGTTDVDGATNVITYTPNGDFFAGTDEFDYTITDVDTEDATGRVTVNIADVTPVLDDDDADVDVNDSVDVDLAALVSTPGNGSIDQHTFDVETDATDGTCLVTDSTLTYTPDPDFVGDDSCEVLVEDGDGDPAFADISFTVSEPSSGGGGGGNGLREDDGGSSADLLILSLLGGSALIRRRRRKA